MGIDSIAQIFLHHGFTRRDELLFPAKRLRAHWFSPPSSGLPRIFVSELQAGLSALPNNLHWIAARRRCFNLRPSGLQQSFLHALVFPPRGCHSTCCSGTVG